MRWHYQSPDLNLIEMLSGGTHSKSAWDSIKLSFLQIALQHMGHLLSPVSYTDTQ